MRRTVADYSRITHEYVSLLVHAPTGKWLVVSGTRDMAHILKAIVRNLRSWGRVVHIGIYPVDMTAALEEGLPPYAYQGKDCHSDAEAALVWHFVQNCQDHRTTGARILCLTASMVSVSYLAGNLSVTIRHLGHIAPTYHNNRLVLILDIMLAVTVVVTRK